MRHALLLVVVACGGPTFVPVTFTMADELDRYDVIAYAEKKLNPNCTQNCELGLAIEDGGCNGLTIRPGGTLDCPPGGGVYLPFWGTSLPPDGGAVTSPVRMLAVGANLRVSDFSASGGAPACDGGFSIQNSTTIRVTRTSTGCTITSR